MAWFQRNVRAFSGGARLPGPAGVNNVVTRYSGFTRPAQSMLVAGPVLTSPPVGIYRKVTRQIGKKLTKLALQKARSRILGNLLRDSKTWKKAFKHIALHFDEKLVHKKAAHTVFKRAHRSKGAVEELLAKVARKPDRAVQLSKATNLDGVANGIPVVILEKRIESVGTKLVLKTDAVGEIIEHETVHILRVVVDYTGRVITAYPVKEFFKGALAVTAAIMVSAVEDAYAAEEETREERDERVCDGTWIIHPLVDWLIADSSCYPDPPPASLAEAQANFALRRIEAELGFALDDATREAVLEDVRSIWSS
jgi:hypothetical protein